MAVVTLSANVNYELHDGMGGNSFRRKQTQSCLCKVCCCASAWCRACYVIACRLAIGDECTSDLTLRLSSIKLLTVSAVSNEIPVPAVLLSICSPNLVVTATIFGSVLCSLG